MCEASTLTSRYFDYRCAMENAIHTKGFVGAWSILQSGCIDQELFPSLKSVEDF